jgi:hypothetical protein
MCTLKRYKVVLKRIQNKNKIKRNHSVCRLFFMTAGC